MKPHEIIEKIRNDLAKEGKLAPPLPSCTAPWCAMCNSYRARWKALGITIPCKATEKINTDEYDSRQDDTNPFIK